MALHSLPPVVARIVWTCMLRASPRRAWSTLSMCVETALRRPRAIRHAFTLALMHKHFYEYVQETSRTLDGLIRELRKGGAGSLSDGRFGRLWKVVRDESSENSPPAQSPTRPLSHVCAIPLRHWRIEHAWAVHQTETTVDFARRSRARADDGVRASHLRRAGLALDRRRQL
jgi:hypothetical protein